MINLFLAGTTASSASLLLSGIKPTGLPGTSAAPIAQASQFSTVQDLIQVELYCGFKTEDFIITFSVLSLMASTFEYIFIWKC